MMKLWKVEIKDEYYGGYDTYDSFIVASEAEEYAVTVHPSGGSIADKKKYGWVDYVDDLTCECIGEAKEGTAEGTVLLASFNAG